MTRPGILYVVICGVANAMDSYGFIKQARADGWDVCAIVTPMGARFVDADLLTALTGHPVGSTYKRPGEPDVLPPPDVCVVAPASFNSVNKIANGISDTLAVGLVCEAIGKRLPVIVAPWVSQSLARHGAYARSIGYLMAEGVRVVLTDRTRPWEMATDAGGAFPWGDVLAELRAVRRS